MTKPMTKPITTFPLKVALAAAGAAALVTACSSSAGGSGGAAPGAGAASQPPLTAAGAGVPAATVPTGIGAAPACNTITLADAQALLVPKITKVKLGPRGCAFERPGQAANGDNLSVDIRTDDADKTAYNTLHSMGTDHSLSGVGDEAYWNQVVPTAGPDLSAHKGTISCVVELPADLSAVTIEKAGSAPLSQVSTSAAAAFAVKMGKLCNDVFAAAG